MAPPSKKSQRNEPNFFKTNSCPPPAVAAVCVRLSPIPTRSWRAHQNFNLLSHQPPPPRLYSNLACGNNLLCHPSPSVWPSIPANFPRAVRRDLLESLRTRRVNHKFHYDSIKQTHKWLALHEAYLPLAHRCRLRRNLRRAPSPPPRQQVTAPAIHLLGLGCGGGQKDTRAYSGVLQSAGQAPELHAIRCPAPPWCSSRVRRHACRRCRPRLPSVGLRPRHRR